MLGFCWIVTGDLKFQSGPDRMGILTRFDGRKGLKLRDSLIVTDRKEGRRRGGPHVGVGNCECLPHSSRTRINYSPAYLLYIDIQIKIRIKFYLGGNCRSNLIVVAHKRTVVSDYMFRSD